MLSLLKSNDLTQINWKQPWSVIFAGSQRENAHDEFIRTRRALNLKRRLAADERR
jgi:hypothetical protein